MTEIKINNISVKVKEDQTILDAAKSIDIVIPTMCWLKGFKASTSCMVCVVKDEKTGKILPSCSALVEEGMNIITKSEEIDDLRKNALELLLSEHSGDCDALCQRVCPAGMDIPLMNRLIAQEKFEDALKVVTETIPIPAILGYICPAPCEKSCRRKDIDEPVSICHLKRFAAETVYQSDIDYLPKIKPDNNKKVAIIGSGPMGLTVAYYLTIEGYNCTIYDENKLPGGKIRTEISEEKLPVKVLDHEIDIIKKMGVRFNMNNKVNSEEIKGKIADKNTAVIITGGFECDINLDDLLKIDTEIKDINIFRYNDTVLLYPHIPVKKSLMSIRSVRTGLRLVTSLDQLLNNEKITAIPKRFNSVYTKLESDEFDDFLKESMNHGQRIELSNHLIGYSDSDAVEEAKRCLHCDCREKDNCLLRDFSDEYNAKQNTYILDHKLKTEKIIQHDIIIYEPQKCIKCGLCVQTTERMNEDIGFTYIGRGFDVKLGFPLNNNIKDAISITAKECAENCPTGAIALI